MARNGIKQHDQLVVYVARQLKQRFYDDIRAHADGFRPPAKVESAPDQPAVVPDVTMVARGAKLNVLEVETSETLNHADTTGKWQALARHAERGGGHFWVVVPQGASAAVMSKLRSVDVQAKVWEVEPEIA
jgi:hypothetical protein